MRNEESSAFQRPFFHSSPRKTTYILFVSRVVTKRNFLGPIRSFDIVNWVNLISFSGSILREIYDPRAVEKLRVSIRVRSFVTVIEAI